MDAEFAIIMVPVITGLFGVASTIAARSAAKDRQRIGDESASQHDVLLGHVLGLSDKVTHGIDRIEVVAKDVGILKEEVQYLKGERV